TDDLQVIPLGKEKLTGTGCVDALQAIQVDPFSHPAIVIDSLWLTDESNVPTDGFSLHDNGFFWVKVTNLLGDATNATIRVVRYTEDSVNIEVSGVPVDLGDIASGETVIVPVGIPFEVKQLGAEAITRLRFEMKADEYDDYQYE